jgi:anti-sigma factor RsiW
MNCQDLRELIPDYLMKKLSPDDNRRFEAHLRECSACRTKLEEMESVWEAVGKYPDEDPSHMLRTRFYSMLEKEKRAMAQAHKEPWLSRLEGWLAAWWPRRPALQLATAVTLLVVGLLLGSGIGTGLQRDGEVAQLRDEVQLMQQMVSLSLLEQNSSSERLRGVNWAERVAEPSDELVNSLTHTLDSDPNPNVRLAAADALLRFRDQPGVLDAAVNSLSQETSPTVQIALIDLLIAIQEKKALEALKNYVQMQNIDPSVREHAESRITDL